MTGGCGKCHVCREPLKTVLDGEEWCRHCATYRRYWQHGFGFGVGEDGGSCMQAAEGSLPPDRFDR